MLETFKLYTPVNDAALLGPSMLAQKTGLKPV